MRLYQLAKQLGKSSEELLNVAGKLNIKIGNRLSGISDRDAAALRSAVGGKPAPQAVQPGAPAHKPQAARPAAPVHKPQPAPARTPPPAPPKAPAPSVPPAPQAKDPVPPRPPLVQPPKSKPPIDTRKLAEQGEAPKRGAAVVQKRRRGRGEDGAVDVDLPAGPVVNRFIPPSSIQRYPRRTMRRPRGRGGRSPMAQAAPRPTSWAVEAPISIKDLSFALGVKANVLMMKLMQQGAMVTINAVLDAEQVESLAKELNLKVEVRAAATAEDVIVAMEAQEDKPEDLKPRPPVVTFMGHVDHGKTSLLDRIRKTNVAAGEFGGITQHIGANRVTIGDRTVVFLDTPGHEAFTAMRSRGANVTDIAVLVVAADDGVMPQTEEAIDHARAANVPIVVAVNKCDKGDANPQRVRQELANLGLQAEEWGGDTVCVNVSALTGKGVDELVEMLSLVAELKELKANPSKPARGTVLDAQISPNRGATATVLVQDGTLRVGDIILCGASFGRVKALYDDLDRTMDSAAPSTPVTVVGLDDLPQAGDHLVVLDDLQKARTIAEDRRRKARDTAMMRREHVSLENLFTSIEKGQLRELKIIIKGDVRGTLEALNKILDGIVSTEVKLRVLRASVGGITTSDVLLADASDAIIVGMNTVPDTAARALAEQKGVAIHTYNVIYRVKEEIEKALSGMLAPEERETVTGHAEVRQIFRISRFGVVAGCFVRDGVIGRNHRLRLVRDGVVIHQGRIGSLRRNKDDQREVREGFECGIHIESYDDVKVGDIVETFQIEKIARTLGAAAGTASA